MENQKVENKIRELTRIEDPLYLKLFVYISSGEANYVQALAKKFNKSIGTVGKQVILLYDLKLLKKIRKGKKVIYKVNWKEFSNLLFRVICIYIKDKKKLKKILDYNNNPDVAEFLKLIFSHYSKEYLKYKEINEKENIHRFAVNLWITIRFLFCSGKITKNMIKSKNLLNLFRILNDSHMDILQIYENSVMKSIKKGIKV